MHIGIKHWTLINTDINLYISELWKLRTDIHANFFNAVLEITNQFFCYLEKTKGHYLHHLSGIRSAMTACIAGILTTVATDLN